MKGFTLFDGCTEGVSGATGADHNGGGVYSSAIGWMENCIVSNCAAYRGGGAFSTRAVDCTFAGNRATYGGGAMSDARAFGCLTYGNTCKTWYVNAGLFYMYEIDRCTCEDSISQTPSNATEIRNTLVRGTYFPNGILSNKVYASAFNTAKLYSVPSGYFNTENGNISTNLASLGVDGRYRPVIGENVAIDRGNASISANLREKDLSGTQRICNGGMDIGALEADWTDRYAADISGGGVVVISAGGGVCETASRKVRIPAGEIMNVAFTRNSSGDRRVEFVLADSSSMSVSVNGAVRVYSGTGAYSLVYGNVPGTDEISFECLSGEAEIISMRLAKAVAITFR